MMEYTTNKFLVKNQQTQKKIESAWRNKNSAKEIIPKAFNQNYKKNEIEFCARSYLLLLN